MFILRRDKITANLALGGIVFECALQNKLTRRATILSQEYEFWSIKDVYHPSPEFITRLSLDLSSSISTDAFRFESLDAGKPIKLIWHFSPNQLQRIEDIRQGKEPWFQIRSRLMVLGQHFKEDGITPHSGPYYAEEAASDGVSNSYPATFKIDHEVWAKLLSDVGFSHIVLQELTIPAFPPEFKRAQNHLKEAWDHHRAGRERPALLSCFGAFECLGYELTGTGNTTRDDVLKLLMDGKEEEKKAKIKALWRAVGDYCHMGRHHKDAPVHLSHRDVEVGLVTATILLRYLAEP